MPIPEWLAAVPEEEWRHWLEDMPSHLAETGQTEHLYTLLTTLDFPLAKIETVGVEQLIADYARAKKLEAISEDSTLQKIADALRASIVRLQQAPDELWNQVKGRSDIAMHTNHPRPVPRLDFRCATLTSADPALLYILHGHTDNITACALSADGKRVLSASSDGTLRLWDTTSGETVRILQGHTGSVTACALSANGQVALSGGQDGTLRLWSTERSETVRILQGHTGSVTACALSANGQVALSGDEKGMLRLWDTERLETLHIWSFPYTKVMRCALSREGKLALSYSVDLTLPLRSTHTLRLWDSTSGEMAHIWKIPLFWAVADCALSADGQRVLVASNLLGFSAKLEIWNAISGRKVRKLKGFKGVVGSCALSDDGHLALSGSRVAYLGTMIESQSRQSRLLALLSSFWIFDNYEGSTLRVWDTKSGKTLCILQGHKDSVAFCAFSADGKLALSASSKLVDDGTSLADPSEHRVLRLWNTASNEASYTQERYSNPVAGCVLSANGHRALTFAKGDRRLRVWDTASGQTLHILQHRQSVASCALSADGRLALSVCYDSRLRLWDTESGKVLRSWMYHIIGMKDCALSADGRWALSLRVDGFLYLWDTTNGQTLTQFLPEEKPDEGYRRWTFNFAGKGFALSADGCRALFVSKDGALQIWNRGDIQALSIIEESLNNVDNWAMSADGQRVLAAAEDGTLRIWNTESGHVLHILKGHTGIVPMCALNANGHLALSASWDRTLRLWDTTSGQEIMRWTHDIALCSCSLSADGRVAVSGDIDGGVHFLEVVGATRTEDIAAAKLPVSWLAENSQSKSGLLRRLFMKKEAEGKKGEVNKQRNLGQEGPKEPMEGSEDRNRDRFDKLPERARRVLSLAQEEAQRFQHNYIGTEHLLLGLVREGEGGAAKILNNLGVELNKVRSAVEIIVGSGDRIVLREIDLDPSAKKVIKIATDEARCLNHAYIGTEHLLLGLVREGESIAAAVLQSQGINLEEARTQTLQMLHQQKREEEVKATMIEVIAESVRIKQETSERVVILKATKQERYLFIWIAHPEAYAIAINLQDTSTSSTLLPHDVLINVIDALDAKLERVEIWDLQEDIFRGRLVLDADGRRLQINARPGDAIAVALRVGAPIFVAEQVMKEAGILLPDTPDESSSFDAQT
jgi:WD40 repeat protein/bifunctional DNase/RNase